MDSGEALELLQTSGDGRLIGAIRRADAQATFAHEHDHGHDHEHNHRDDQHQPWRAVDWDVTVRRSKAEQEKIMQAWGNWFRKLGRALVDGGNPFSDKVKSVGSVR